MTALLKLSGNTVSHSEKRRLTSVQRNLILTHKTKTHRYPDYFDNYTTTQTKDIYIIITKPFLQSHDITAIQKSMFILIQKYSSKSTYYKYIHIKLSITVHNNCHCKEICNNLALISHFLSFDTFC